MKMREFKIEIFADGANIEKMLELNKLSYISGFTTNPSLLRKAGVTDYLKFVKEASSALMEKSLSLEVIHDEGEQMLEEARLLSSFGDNIMVKIPIVSSKGTSSVESIRMLSAEGINLNITALFTPDQAKAALEALSDSTCNYISVFAGRIADTGRDPQAVVSEIKAMCTSKPRTKVLWASCREVYNIIQAEQCGCDIITVTNDILKKLGLLDKDLEDYSRETAAMFYQDAAASGLTIPVEYGENK